VDVARLPSRVGGKVIGREHPEYRPLWESNWNQLRPQGYPDVIVAAASDRDAILAALFLIEVAALWKLLPW